MLQVINLAASSDMEVHAWHDSELNHDLSSLRSAADLKRWLFEEDWDCYYPSVDAKVMESFASMDKDDIVLSPLEYSSDGIDSEWMALDGDVDIALYDGWHENENGVTSVQKLCGEGIEVSSPASSLSYDQVDRCSYTLRPHEHFFSLASYDNEIAAESNIFPLDTTDILHEDMTACHPAVMPSNVSVSDCEDTSISANLQSSIKHDIDWLVAPIRFPQNTEQKRPQSDNSSNFIDNSGTELLIHNSHCVKRFKTDSQTNAKVDGLIDDLSLRIPKRAERKRKSRSKASKPNDFEDFSGTINTKPAFNHHVEQTSSIQGVQSVQLILSVAEAVACRDKQRALQYLQELKLLTSPHGDSVQRLTYYFSESLHARLSAFESISNAQIPSFQKSLPQADKQEAFELVYRHCPYISFSHYVANRSILEAFEGESMVHVVDLGMPTGLQWQSLLQELALRPEGAPKRVRITAVGFPSPSTHQAKDNLLRLAASLNLPLEFRIVNSAVENLQRDMLDITLGEALAVNSIFQLHCIVKESRVSLKSILQLIRELSPKVVTVAEQDSWHNGPFFLGRFVEALHYYAAIFDNMDEILPRSSAERQKMEHLYYAQEIMNIIACEGCERLERHERLDQWRRRLNRSGFQAKALRFVNEARKCLAMAFPCTGYTVEEEKGSFVLGWKGKPVVSISTWKC